MNNVNIIPLRNNILVDVRTNEIKKLIIQRLNELNLVDSKYKLCIELLTYISSILENVVNKKEKLNKLDILISIYKELFGINSEEETIIKSNIDYLCKNKCIKKLSYYKLFKTGFSEWFKKKT